MASALTVAVFRLLPRRLGMRLVRLATPSYTLGVQVLVLAESGELLLVEQPYRTLPFLPGGALKRGEDVLSGARRELREETGLDVDVRLLGTPQVRPRARWVTFYAVATVDGATAAGARAAGGEVSGLIWADPDDLPLVDAAVTLALDHARRVPESFPRS